MDIEAPTPPEKEPRPIPAAVFRELARQQSAVYEAKAVLQCLTTTEEHASNWPPELPQINFALRPVVNILEGVATALYEAEFTAAVAEWGGDE